MARSRSRSGCHRVPISVYCGGGHKKRHKSRRRGGCGRKKRSRSRRRSRHGRSRSRCGKRSRSRRRSRRRRCGHGKKKKCRGGIKTRNPFLNYLRVFRKKHCRWPQCKIAIEGAKCWCKMSNQERQKFYKQACSMRKKGKGRRKGRRRRGRSRRRGGCGRKRKRSRRRKRRSCPK